MQPRAHHAHDNDDARLRGRLCGGRARQLQRGRADRHVAGGAAARLRRGRCSVSGVRSGARARGRRLRGIARRRGAPLLRRAATRALCARAARVWLPAYCRLAQRADVWLLACRRTRRARAQCAKAAARRSAHARAGLATATAAPPAAARGCPPATPAAAAGGGGLSWRAWRSRAVRLRGAHVCLGVLERGSATGAPGARDAPRAHATRWRRAHGLRSSRARLGVRNTPACSAARPHDPPGVCHN
jgi:hypothetical protein